MMPFHHVLNLQGITTITINTLPPSNSIHNQQSRAVTPVPRARYHNGIRTMYQASPAAASTSSIVYNRVSISIRINVPHHAHHRIIKYNNINRQHHASTTHHQSASYQYETHTIINSHCPSLYQHFRQSFSSPFSSHQHHYFLSSSLIIIYHHQTRHHRISKYNPLSQSYLSA